MRQIFYGRGEGQFAETDLLRSEPSCWFLWCKCSCARFWNKIKGCEKIVKSQSTYSLHKPARRRYSTRHYQISGTNHLWQADLAAMQPYANQNDGYNISCVSLMHS